MLIFLALSVCFSLPHVFEDIEEVYTKFVLILMTFLTCLFLLTCHRRSLWKAKYNYSEVKRVSQASHVLYQQTLKGEIEAVSLEKLLSTKLILDSECPEEETKIRYFFWRKLKFYFDPEDGELREVRAKLNNPLEELDVETQPHVSLFDDAIALALQEANKLDFPLPNFGKLLLDQLLEPLNFFQFFSVLLWIFDDGFFYPIVMMCALLMTNFMVCMQRLSTIMGLRSLRSTAFRVKVLDKDFKLKVKSSEDLRPGDVILVQRSKDLKDRFADRKSKKQNNDSKHNDKNNMIEKDKNGKVVKTKRERDEEYLNQRERVRRQIHEAEEIRGKVPFGKYIPLSLFKNMLKNSKGQSDSKKNAMSCDLLILRGSAVVDESILTGENIPQVKSRAGLDSARDGIDKDRLKGSVLFGGTETLQLQPEETKFGAGLEGRLAELKRVFLENNVNNSDFPANILQKEEALKKLKGLSREERKALDRGTLAMVLDTGFHTTQGEVTRTVLFSQDDAVSHKECYILLVLLLLVSIFTSVYVLLKGLEEENRDKDKLFLRCIMIVTNVVPPELPMIMNMAVNGSIANLKKRRIFCTDPYRIMLAGKVGTLVFDKTGTLTKDGVHFKGIGTLPWTKQPRVSCDITECFKDPKMPLREQIHIILAGCHSLIRLDGEILGDPVEKLFFDHSNFKLANTPNTSTAPSEGNKIVGIKRSYPFRSHLKRMTTVVTTKNFAGLNGYFVVSKGAPEIFESLPDSELPPDYRKHYTLLAEQGYRLLSLFYKKTDQKATKAPREELERGLRFAGFLLLDNKLKVDTKKYVKKFLVAGKEIKILSGDNLFTCVKIFRQLEVNKKGFVQLMGEGEKVGLRQFGDIQVGEEVPDFIELAGTILGVMCKYYE